jgi:hypothetical protein
MGKETPQTKYFIHYCYIGNHEWGEKGKFLSYKVCPDCVANDESYTDARAIVLMRKTRMENNA